MKVVDCTAVFKSRYTPYMLERGGVKPNTVRKIPPGELRDFLRWANEIDPHIRIELSDPDLHKKEWSPPEPSFTRRVTNVFELGEILGEKLFVISWIHDSEGT